MPRKLRKQDQDAEPEVDERSEEAGEHLDDAPQPKKGAKASPDDLQAECEELRSKWLRAQADYQNLKRRQLSDIEAALRRSQSSLLENLLIVLDHLDMALASPTETEEGKNLAMGVRLTRDQLVQCLEREEVVAIDTDGPFDPEVHQAVATLELEGAEPGTILEVTRPGWSHRGQVLRPAQVKVAAGPETAPEASPVEDGQEAS